MYFILSYYKYLEMREDYSLNHFKTLQIISSTLMGLHIFISLKAYLYHMPSNQQPTSCLLHKDFSKCLLNIFSLSSHVSTAKQGKNNLILKRILSVLFSYKIISFFTTYRQVPCKEIKSKNKKIPPFLYSFLTKNLQTSLQSSSFTSHYIKRHAVSREYI